MASGDLLDDVAPPTLLESVELTDRTWAAALICGAAAPRWGAGEACDGLAPVVATIGQLL